MKIAVIDDHQMIRESFVEILKLQAYQAESFASSELFLATGRSDDFDCLIVDLRLPGLNGIELIQSLRKQSISTPAILISGNMDTEILNTIEHLPHVIPLTKPCPARTILEAVSDLKGQRL